MASSTGQLSHMWHRGPEDTLESLTKTYRWFLARWAKRLCWKDVAEAFETTWENVFRSVKMAVRWGLEHRDLTGITAIGVDEVQFHRGQNYITLVCQIDNGYKRLLWLGKKRTAKTLLKFFRWFGPLRAAELRFVCRDMWKPPEGDRSQSQKGA